MFFWECLNNDIKPKFVNIDEQSYHGYFPDIGSYHGNNTTWEKHP